MNYESVAEDSDEELLLEEYYSCPLDIYKAKFGSEWFDRLEHGQEWHPDCPDDLRENIEEMWFGYPRSMEESVENDCNCLIKRSDGLQLHFASCVSYHPAVFESEEVRE